MQSGKRETFSRGTGHQTNRIGRSTVREISTVNRRLRTTKQCSNRGWTCRTLRRLHTTINNNVVEGHRLMVAAHVITKTFVFRRSISILSKPLLTADDDTTRRSDEALVALLPIGCCTTRSNGSFDSASDIASDGNEVIRSIKLVSLPTTDYSSRSFENINTNHQE